MSLQSMSLREAWAPRVVCCFGGALAKAKHETTAVANLSQHVNMSQHLRQISRLSAPSRNSTVAIDMALGYAFGRNLGMGVAALRCRSDVSESFR